MKYFSILLVSTVALTSAKPKISNYIKTCNRNGPKLNECFINSIRGMIPNMSGGFPELNVTSMDPMYFKKLIFNLGDGFETTNRNVKLEGVKDLIINDFVADIDSDIFSFNVTFPQLNYTAIYEIDAMIASIPIKGKGPMKLTAQIVNFSGALHGEKVVRGDETWYYFPRMDMKMGVVDYEIELGNLYEKDSTIGEVTNQLLNNDKTQVMAHMLPSIEKVTIENILSFVNNMVKHFTWDELFPES